MPEDAVRSRLKDWQPRAPRCTTGVFAEHAANRIIFPPAMERRRQLEEGIRQIRRDLDDRRVPLIIGGGGPRSTLPIVARYADYWNMTTNSVEVFRARSERLSELCRAAGRNPAEIQRSVAVGYLLGRNEAELAMRSERVRSLIPPLTEAVDTRASGVDHGLRLS